MSKSVKKIASFALPAAGMLIPGLSPLGMAALGAAGGALGGGGLKGALLGGLGSAISSGGILGNTLGSTGGKILGGAISGLGSGGGLTGALLGAGGGLAASQLGGSKITADSLNSAKPTVGSIAQPASTFGGLSSFAKPLIGAIGAYNDMSSADELEKLVRDQQARNQQAMKPYTQSGYQANKALQDRLAAGFQAPDLANDPGYQFQLQQANKGADRADLARGGYFSGAALKAASDRAQGLADTTYNDAYQRWLQQNQQLAGQSGQGLNALGAVTGFGDTAMQGSGLALGQKTNSLNQYLAKLTGDDDKTRLLKALGISV